MTSKLNRWILLVVFAICVLLVLFYIVGRSSDGNTGLRRPVLKSGLKSLRIIDLEMGMLSKTQTGDDLMNSTSHKLENIANSRSEPMHMDLTTSKSEPPKRQDRPGNIIESEHNPNNVTTMTATSSTKRVLNMDASEHSSGKHFMLSLVYAEQFTNAFSHYNEFLVLASRLNYTGVEPFVHNSRMVGVRSLLPDPHTCFDLGLLINIESLNSQFSTCFKKNTLKTTEPYIINPMGDFLKHSHRKLLVIYFAWHMFILPKPVHKSMDSALSDVFSKQNQAIFANCRDIANKVALTTHIELLLNKDRVLQTNLSDVNNFTVQDVLCVNRVPLSLEQLTDHLARYLNNTKSYSNVSIVFVSWQGKFTREFTDWRTFDFHCIKPPALKVKLSETVHHFADKFQQSIGLFKQNFISVHVRFEKLFQFAYNERKNSQEKFYSCCMKRLELVLEHLAKKYNVLLKNTLLLYDYGTFGTDSCRFQGRWSPHHLCEEETKKLLGLLNVTASEFNPRRFKGAPDNSGFASLVDETSLFSGQVLVAVGGGGYQSGVIGRYINWHKNDTYSADELHYQLCIGEKLNGLQLDYPVC